MLYSRIFLCEVNFFHFYERKSDSQNTFVAEMFSLNAAVKEKGAQTTSGTFRVHP